jgi:hypothetical protein
VTIFAIVAADLVRGRDEPSPHRCCCALLDRLPSEGGAAAGWSSIIWWVVLSPRPARCAHDAARLFVQSSGSPGPPALLIRMSIGPAKARKRALMTMRRPLLRVVLTDRSQPSSVGHLASQPGRGSRGEAKKDVLPPGRFWATAQHSSSRSA